MTWLFVIGLALAAAALLTWLIWYIATHVKRWIEMFQVGLMMGLMLYILRHPKKFDLEMQQAAEWQREIMDLLRGK